MTAARDMNRKAVIARIRGYMAHASEMLKDLPDIYKPGARRDDESSDSEDEGGANKKRKVAFEKRREMLVKRGLAGNATRAKSRKELEERFQAKIASFNPEARGKSERKQQKLAKKAQILEKKKEKKKDKKKREKQRQKIRRKGAAEDGEGHATANNAVKKIEATNGVPSPASKAVEKPQKKEVVEVRPEDEQIAFSKFDFAGTGHDETTKKANKSLKKVLTTLQKSKQKEEKLKEKGDVEGLKSLKQKTIWENALSKAEGQKVKTDIGLVKKSLKRQEAKKKSSTKQWKSRLDSQQDQHKQRQDKRSANLQSRRDAKVKKKVKRSIKKGRVVF